MLPFIHPLASFQKFFTCEMVKLLKNFAKLRVVTWMEKSVCKISWKLVENWLRNPRNSLRLVVNFKGNLTISWPIVSDAGPAIKNIGSTARVRWDQYWIIGDWIALKQDIGAHDQLHLKISCGLTFDILIKTSRNFHGSRDVNGK